MIDSKKLDAAIDAVAGLNKRLDAIKEDPRKLRNPHVARSEFAIARFGLNDFRVVHKRTNKVEGKFASKKEAEEFLESLV